jgi:hypothetical protein
MADRPDKTELMGAFRQKVTEMSREELLVLALRHNSVELMAAFEAVIEELAVERARLRRHSSNATRTC